MKFLPPAYVSFLLFVLVAAFGFGNLPVFIDPDTAWHLAAGDLIRATQSIPQTDTWSFTTAGERWYNLSWLFDVIISIIFAQGGFSALYLLTIATFACSLVMMANHSIRRGASPIAVFFVVLCMALVLHGHVMARPNMCSLVLTAICYQCLYRYRETGRWLCLLWLPALLAIWVNLHGGFLLAFFLIGVFLLEALVQRNRTQARVYGTVFAASLAATLANPYGFALYYGAYRTLSGTFGQTAILEWQPADISHDLPMALLVLLILCIGHAFDRRQPFTDRLLSIFLCILALSSIRYSSIAALLLIPYLSLRLTTESWFARHLEKWDIAILRDMRQPDIRILGAGMAVGAMILITLPYPRDTLLSEPIGFPKKAFPVAEAEYIAAHYPALRFFNHYNIGGYLDYLWRGHVKTFVDGRCSSLYNEDVLQDFSDFTNNYGFGGRAEAIAARYRLDGLIIPHNLPNAKDWIWNPYWRLVYNGPVAAVFLRNNALPASYNSNAPQ